MDVKLLKRFLSRYSHWILLIVIGISLIAGFTSFTYSQQDIIAIVFGVIGLVGVAYITAQIEVRKREEQDSK
ncbi:hypothetical protein [Paenisporosarcina sp. OV554]|uniref:hypothetical protein n=1 Tax=Paenisporosarcina sp. OV554 TaxID=2135694 RepID=UPI001304F603|nr:hypothetical protein [Paenisporosarcina sp. OV554]